MRAARWRQIVAAGMGNGVVTVSAALVGVITLPMLVNYVGVEVYGLWVAVNAVAVLGVVGDLGVGNALVSRLAGASHAGDPWSAQEVVSSGFAIVCVMASALVAALTSALVWVDWRAAFNIPPSVSDSLVLAVIAAAAFGFIAGFPLGYLGRILPALQRGHVVAWYNVATIWAGAFVLWVTIAVRASTASVLIWQVAIRIAGSAAAVVHTSIVEPTLRPRWRFATRACARELARDGRRQVLMNVGHLLSAQSFYLVGPHALALGQLGNLAIAHRVYSMVSSLLVPFYTPMWPAIAEAIARGDERWVVRSFRLLVGAGIALAIVCGVLLFLYLDLLYALLHIQTAAADRDLRTLLAIWLIGTIWMQAAGNFLQGVRRTRQLAAYMFLSSVASLPIMIMGGTAYGPAGLVGAWLASYMLVCSLGMLQQVRVVIAGFTP